MKETIHTNKKQVSCSGREVPYDHPTVYLEIEESTGKIECPYCSKNFVLNSKPANK